MHYINIKIAGGRLSSTSSDVMLLAPFELFFLLLAHFGFAVGSLREHILSDHILESVEIWVIVQLQTHSAATLESNSPGATSGHIWPES